MKKANSTPPQSGEIFISLVKLIANEGTNFMFLLLIIRIKILLFLVPEKIEIPTLVGYIKGCLLDNQMKNCYELVFLKAFRDYILSNLRCRGKLGRDAWQGT